jgi:hypothetical protein
MDACGSMFIKQKIDRADRGLCRLCSMKVPFEWARSQQELAHFFARTAAVDRSWLGGLSHWITFPDVSASSCFVTQFSSVRAPLATPCHFTSFPGFAPLLLTRETGENETRVGYGSTLKIQHVKRRVGEKGKHHGESKKQCCNIKSGRVVKFAFCVKHSLSHLSENPVGILAQALCHGLHRGTILRAECPRRSRSQVREVVVHGHVVHPLRSQQ